MSRPSPTMPANVVIDTRPLRTILLERAVRPASLAVAAGLYWLISTRTVPEGLSPAGLQGLAVFAPCLVLWLTGALPLMVTSLLAFVLLPWAGVLSRQETYALLGNEAVFFILGVFILAACLIRSRLSTRIALVILRRFGHTPRRLLISVFLLNAVMSFFMSEHAVAAMNFPIVLEIINVLRLPKHKSTYARALLLAMAWGTTIGGVATLLGGARAPLALGIVREATGQSFTFLGWAIATLPIVLIMMVCALVVIVRFFPIDIENTQAADDMIAERAMALGRTSLREKATAAVMLVTLAAWMAGGEQMGLASVALAAVVAVFTLGLVSWSDVETNVNWGILLMYGGAIALGTALARTGAALWLSQHTISHWAESAYGAIAIISALALILTEAMSNAAVVAMMMPITLGVAQDFAMEPRVMALVVAVPAGLSFALPIGTPANAIAYASGYVTMRDMLIPGIILNVLSWLTVLLVARVYWPWLGIVVAG
jgi:solute carrier family 13 (sodium-dependent dicarboxylate transporter), member 2/3/5